MANPSLGFTPLHSAALLGHEDTARLLLESGADIIRRGFEGDTQLHIAINAVKSEETEGVVRLLKNKGQTPLNLAIELGRLEFVKMLREKLGTGSVFRISRG